MSTDTITLPAITPATPLVLCDTSFLSTLAQVEASAAALTVKDAQSAQAAADLQQRLTKAGTALEKTRKELIAPFLAKQGEINDAARGPAARIEAAKTRIKQALTAFAVEQERIRREEAIARQKELDRLEAIRLRQLKEQEEAAQALARKVAEEQRQRDLAAQAAGTPPSASDETFDFDEGPPEPPPKSEIEKQIEAVRYAPAAPVAKPVGVSFRVRLTFRVVDPAKVPDVFCNRTVNEAAIRSLHCTQYKEGQPLPEVPGIEFTVEKTAVSTGRASW